MTDPTPPLTAEQIAELLAFARDYSWEDTVGTIDAEHAADEILGVIENPDLLKRAV